MSATTGEDEPFLFLSHTATLSDIGSLRDWWNFECGLPVKRGRESNATRVPSRPLVAARFTLHGFRPLFSDDGNHDESSSRISPPPSERRVKQQTNQQNSREVNAEV